MFVSFASLPIQKKFSHGSPTIDSHTQPHSHSYLIFFDLHTGFLPHLFSDVVHFAIPSSFRFDLYGKTHVLSARNVCQAVPFY